MEKEKTGLATETSNNYSIIYLMIRGLIYFIPVT